METWQRVWREGIAPQLSTEGLRALETALERDDPRLAQGATTFPPPLKSMLEAEVVSACAVTFCAWHGDGLSLVGQVDEFFANLCWQCDQRMGEGCASGHFVRFFDDTPRSVMRATLLPEVRLALARREVAPCLASCSTN